MNQPDIQDTTFSLASMYAQLKAFNKKLCYFLKENHTEEQQSALNNLFHFLFRFPVFRKQNN